MKITLEVIIFAQTIANIIAFVILGVVIITSLKYRIKADRNSLTLHPEGDRKGKRHKFLKIHKRKRNIQMKQAHPHKTKEKNNLIKQNHG